MKDFKVTKGKWVSRHNGNYWEVNREEDFNDGKRLAISVMVFNVADGGCVFNRSGEDKANAQLIAAAPELLHRLNSLMLSIKAHPDYQTGRNQEFTDLVSLAEETINKALGKEAADE